MKRFAKIVVGVFAVWIALLFILGFALANSTGRAVSGRLGESLRATSKFASSTLGLVRGKFYLEQMSLRRDDVIGQLSLDVGEVTCDLPPLGVALVDRDCRQLAVDGVRLEVSTAALFKLPRPVRKPFVAEHVTLTNAELTFSPSAFVPGFGRIHIAIAHAEAGRTLFKTPLSWLFHLEEIDAAFDLPANISLRLAYRAGRLTASGNVFGSKPVELTIALPSLDGSEDAQTEIAKLVAFAKSLAEQLVEQRVENWLKFQ